MVEIHITTNGLNNIEVEEFIMFCEQYGFKPILIELNEGDVQQQPMISKVIDSTDRDFVLAEIEKIKASFLESGYEIRRVKVEVPLEYAYLSQLLYPDYLGQYAEWHGKINLKSADELERLESFPSFKVSNSSLKGEAWKRFVTYRDYGSLNNFKYRVDGLKYDLKAQEFEIIKEEWEYCIYDSNKSLDRGWIATPEITDNNYLMALAIDEVIKRQSRVNNALVLKGSLATRQFIEDLEERTAQDLDFVAHGVELDDPFSLFSKWITEITHVVTNGQVEIDSFTNNDFWRRREYAMSDDFPTTNTDLTANFSDGRKRTLGLDISWGLPLHDQVVDLDYRCLDGTKINLKVVDLPIQISWKLHQSLTRPRAKDFLDVILLLKKNKLSPDKIQRVKYFLREECARDKIAHQMINYYSNGEVSAWMKSVDYKDDYNSLESPFGITFGGECCTSHLNLLFPKAKYNSIVSLVEEFELSLAESNLRYDVEEF